jgi:P pilus assembly chaperone PapD
MQVRKWADRKAVFGLAMVFLWLSMAGPATAELVVSQLIIEFKPGATRTADIEIVNKGDERSYIVVEPREVLKAGQPGEERVATPDPAKLGLLASPARFILEPQQRRTLRIAAIGAASERERVYRVTVKPVTGAVSGSESGLKLLVGYDLLVLVRPPIIRTAVGSKRAGSRLTLINDGNASVELAEGKLCDPGGKNCQALPAKRLYAGANWSQELPGKGRGEYRIRSAEGWSTLRF